MAFDFWKTDILKWESTRYDRWYSKFIFSSLHHRRQYIAYLINQLPDNSALLELGCGSGRLFELLDPKKNFQYTGVDISELAIARAKDRFARTTSSKWITAEIKDIFNMRADVCISAGLLDWVETSDMKLFLQKNKFQSHIHSFSQNKTNWMVGVHRLFKKSIQLIHRVRYEPRKHTKDEIEKLFECPGAINAHKVLSFGAIFHTLKPTTNLKIESYLVYDRFKKKRQQTSSVERYFKKKEINSITPLIYNARNKSVLEVGSGSGVFSQIVQTLSPKRHVALDPSVNTVHFGLQNKNFHFISSTIENWNSAETFQFVLAFGVAEFIQNHLDFLTKLRNHLEQDGQILLLTPTEDSIIRKIYKIFYTFNGISLNFLTIQKIKDVFGPDFRIQIKSAGLLNQIVVIEKVVT